MSFTIEQLRIFAAIVDSGSFSAAARSLGRAQSAVSMSISNLEIDLDVVLFERNGRSPTLTDAGRMLLDEAKAILLKCAAFEERASCFNDEIEAEILISLENAIPLSAILPALKQWQSEFPSVTLNFTYPKMSSITEKLSHNQIDLALMLVQPNYPKEIAFSRLGRLRMVEVACWDHPLASERAVSFASLADYRQLIFSPHGYAIESSEYVVSPLRYYTESYLALKSLLCAGLGWAMMPYRLVEDLIRSGDLAEIDMAAYPHTSWLVEIDLLWRRGRKLGKASRRLRDLISMQRITDQDLL